MTFKKFLIIFIPYLLAYLGYIIFELTIGNNIDVKGWWPMALTFVVVFHALVAALYCGIDKLSPSSHRYTAIYGLLFTLPLAISFLIREIIYPIDWYAVNLGYARLTTVQTMFASPLISLLIIGLILLSHFIIRWWMRSKNSLRMKG